MPSRASSPPRRPPAARGGVAERRARALEEPLDIRRLPGIYPRLEVRNAAHHTRYTVLLPVFPARDVALCTCTDFARSGLGTCKHVEAADRWLRANPAAQGDPDPASEESAPPVWAAVDAERRTVPTSASPAKKMRWAGATLWKRHLEKG